MFKPEFCIEDRQYFSDQIYTLMDVHGLSIQDKMVIEEPTLKMEVFDHIYENLLFHSATKRNGVFIGSYEFLKEQDVIRSGDLFDLWISQLSYTHKLDHDQYAMWLQNSYVINPFVPQQRHIFVHRQCPIDAFVIKKESLLSWQELKKNFQGDPVQERVSSSSVRGILCGCSWYSPSTNGIHLSGSEHEALRELSYFLEHSFLLPRDGEKR